MPAGDVPEGVRAGQHGQTEGKRDPEEADPQLNVVIGEELAARTALPHPPNTSKNVPRNSAPSLAANDGSCMWLLLA